MCVGHVAGRHRLPLTPPPTGDEQKPLRNCCKALVSKTCISISASVYASLGRAYARACACVRACVCEPVCVCVSLGHLQHNTACTDTTPTCVCVCAYIHAGLSSGERPRGHGTSAHCSNAAVHEPVFAWAHSACAFVRTFPRLLGTRIRSVLA